MTSLKTYALALMFTLPLTATAAPWVLDASHTRIGFAIDHMGYSTTYGQFKTHQGTVDYDPAQPAQTKIKFTIDTTSLDTDWAPRDDHLLGADFFNAKQHPTMTFVSSQYTPLGGNKARVDGQLTLLGMSQPVTLDVTLNKHAVSPLTKLDTIGFKATTLIKRSQWGMTTFLPAVADEVHISIDAELNPAQ